MARQPKTDTRRVRLVAPGAKAAGPYLAGQEYAVPAAEAARLVAVKGFVYTDEPAPPASTED